MWVELTELAKDVAESDNMNMQSDIFADTRLL